MACRQYYDGLCVGGDCRGCRYKDSSHDDWVKDKNIQTGVGLIVLGVCLAILAMIMLVST
jgi:hypothetical protein